MHTVLVTVLLAAVLVSCDAQPPADPPECDITDPERLSGCISRLLISARPLVRWPWLLDPLRLPNSTCGHLDIWDALVIDLSHYSVGSVSAAILSSGEIAVNVQLQWPQISGAFEARLRKCHRLVLELCVTVAAHPHVHLSDTLGSIATILRLDRGSDGRPRIRASYTVVALKPADLQVKVNLRGVTGAVNNIIGDPGSRIATDLASQWWTDNRPMVEAKISQKLEHLVENELTRDLDKLVNCTST